MKFLIRPRAGKRRRSDDGQSRRLLLYLGGTPTPAGFAFPTDGRRQIAWQLLCERFGPRCFEKHDEVNAVPDPM